MNEDKIYKYSANLMFSVIENLKNSKENWLELYAALAAVKTIFERMPIEAEITTQDIEEATRMGNQIGKEMADRADQETNNWRN
jgi:hypothetical protein